MITAQPTLTDLDSLRAATMRVLLTPEGQRYIWQYDIVPLRTAFDIAREDYNFDNLQTTATALQEGKRYALIGGGICDHPFTTPAELIDLIDWLCNRGYLSCYSRSAEAAAGRKDPQ